MENKFLQNKVVYLKPVPRSGGMVTDQKHIAYFKMEGAYDSYTLKMDEVTKRIGEENIGGGFSLRFPRLVEWNRDKSANDATRISEVEEMFLMKRG
mgnify:CR=1 FL=1